LSFSGNLRNRTGSQFKKKRYRSLWASSGKILGGINGNPRKRKSIRKKMIEWFGEEKMSGAPVKLTYMPRGKKMRNAAQE